MPVANRIILCASAVLVATACGSKGASTSGGQTGGAHTGASSGSGAAGTGGTSASSTSTSSGAAGSSSSGAALCSGPGYTGTGSLFKTSEPWNTAVDKDAVDPQSGTIINWLATAGGWGNGNVFQIDTSITVLCADATTPMVPFTNGPNMTDPTFCAPDCDDKHTTFPVPTGGAIEGESGYACKSGGDCHMLVVDLARNLLWEMYSAFNPPPDPTNFYSVGGATIWDLTHAYSPTLRGDGCTSSDAGGFPVAAMVFSADEVAAGSIDHAIRFILPNARIRDGDLYVHPATHTGVTSSAGAPTRPNAPPYGVRLRLKSSFDVTKLNKAGQVVAKALQTYGMFLSDGGNIALTATNDTFTKAKWADVGLGTKDLNAIQVTDFDIVDMGPVITTGDSCTLNGYRVP